MEVSGRDTVAVFGQGPVGLSGTLSAIWMGAKVIAIDIVPDRLELAHGLGADHVINSSDVDAVEAIKELTSGQGATAVLEPSGNPGARQQALQCIHPFGRCCYVAIGGPAQVDFNQDIIFKVASVYGSWTFSKAELLEIARFMVEDRVPLQKLITHRYDLDQAVEAFRTFDGATTGKCVFVMN